MTAPSLSVAPTRYAVRVWRWLGSIRLAVIALIAVALAALVGTLFPQLSPDVVADPSAFADWMTRAQDRYGALTDLLFALGLFDVFHSAWFVLLLGLLLLNTAVCTLNRIQSIWRVLTRPPVRMPDAFFRRAGRWLAMGVSADAVEVALRRQGYRVFRRDEGLTSFFYADRNWVGRVGTLITHVALVVLVLAAAWGRAVGWREESFMLPRGQPRAVGHGLPFQLRADGFEIVRYPNGMPRDYRAHVTVLEDGREVLRRTIRINAPLTYRGATFYLASYIPTPDGSGVTHVVLKAVHDPGYVPVIVSGVAMLVGLVLSFYLPHRRLWVRVTQDGEVWIAGKTERGKEEPAPWLAREAEKLRTRLERRRR